MSEKAEIEWIDPQEELPKEFETVIVVHRVTRDAFQAIFRRGKFGENFGPEYDPHHVIRWAHFPVYKP